MSYFYAKQNDNYHYTSEETKRNNTYDDYHYVKYSTKHQNFLLENDTSQTQERDANQSSRKRSIEGNVNRDAVCKKQRTDRPFSTNKDDHQKSNCKSNEKVSILQQNGRTNLSKNIEKIQVKGSLKKHVKFWRETLKANSFILDTIEHGYRIPFRYFPHSFKMNNNKSALKEPEFVEKTLLELLDKGHIYEVKNPFTISPLSVSEDPSGKKRLILDLTYINKFLWKEKIKFDDWKSFENYVDEGKEGICSNLT